MFVIFEFRNGEWRMENGEKVKEKRRTEKKQRRRRRKQRCTGVKIRD